MEKLNEFEVEKIKSFAQKNAEIISILFKND